MTYNGLGGAGTGGPLGDFLEEEGDQWIKDNHLHLHYTLVQKWANENNVDLLFITPYDFKVQPSYRERLEGRQERCCPKILSQTHHSRHREQLLYVFDTRITPELTAKLIRQSENEMMKMIEQDELFQDLGRIGTRVLY